MWESTVLSDVCWVIEIAPLTECHQRQVVDSTSPQPVCRRQRTLAASTTKNNTPRAFRLRGNRLDVLDVEPIRARKRRLRCLIDAAQIDHQIVRSDRLWRDKGHESLRFGRSGKTEAAERQGPRI